MDFTRPAGAWLTVGELRRALADLDERTPIKLDVNDTQVGVARIVTSRFLVEIVAARTAARLVGDGIYTWTAVLGAVLLGWALGCAVGGRLADGGDPRRLLARLLLLASVVVAMTAWTPAVLPPLVAAPAGRRPRWSPAYSRLQVPKPQATEITAPEATLTVPSSTSLPSEVRALRR